MDAHIGMGNDDIDPKNKKKTRVPFPVKKTTIDRIIYPVYTKKGLKYGKKRTASVENTQLI